MARNSRTDNTDRPLIGRGEFLAAAGVLALGTAGCGSVRDWIRDFDLLITGGIVLDGTGADPVEADVGIRDGRIAAIGDLKTQSARRIISANGLAVAPGFIDLHAHSDTNLLVDGRGWSKIFQGVTTEVVGQDGRSEAPLHPGRGGWVDFNGYFRTLRSRGISLNLTSMVGAGTLRGYVIGQGDRFAENSDIQRMRELFRAALSQGARHLSSGLEYQPGSFASDAELVGIFGGLTREEKTGLVYATHMRNEDDRIESALQEAITIARWAGVGLHISHFKVQGNRNWKRLPELLDRIDRARGSGMRITFDRYPYLAYSTGLQNLFPMWARDGSRGSFVHVMRSAEHYEQLRRAVEKKVRSLGSWNAVQIARVYASSRSLEGRRLGDLAAETGRDPYEFLRDLLIREKGGGVMVGFGMNDETTDRILKDPHCAIASDGSTLAVNGPLSGGVPHPRSFGTFPRVLGHYVRERRLLSLSEAVRKMTGLPAAILGLRDRGLLQPGFAADLTLFDPDGIRDRATFIDPRQYSFGIRTVIVNGEVVVDGGDHTGARPGKVLRGEDFVTAIV